MNDRDRTVILKAAGQMNIDARINYDRGNCSMRQVRVTRNVTEWLDSVARRSKDRSVSAIDFEHALGVAKTYLGLGS